MRAAVYVTAQQLARELKQTHPPKVLDVRWSLTQPNGYPAYVAGRIPGARYVDLESDLTGDVGPTTGRHPLPTVGHLQQAARRWGLNNGDRVVVYDGGSGVGASRAWWVLRWAGVGDVRILNGGYPVWAGHGENETGIPPRRKRKDRGNITLSGGHLPTVEAEDLENFTGVVIDARNGERYRGEFEPVDPVAGHIPQAVNLPYAGNLTSFGLIKPESELRERFAPSGALDASDVAVYCGSGVTATHHVAALASLGVQAALYPGSWSQWITDPNRPRATGDEKGNKLRV